jgi:hypothetical protein
LPLLHLAFHKLPFHKLPFPLPLSYQFAFVSIHLCLNSTSPILPFLNSPLF